MKEGKYIVYMDEEAGTEVPVLFPSYIKHSYIARGFDRVLSAGFFKLTTRLGHGRSGGNEVVAYGESTSLHKASVPERDSALIARLLGIPDSEGY